MGRRPRYALRYFVAVCLLLGVSASPAVTPQLELKDLHGNTHTLLKYRGEIVVLNFWATWCVACKTEMPIFTEIYHKYRDQGIIVLAASLDDASTRKYVPQYARSYKIEFPVLINAATENMHQFGLGDTLPSTVFLDERGNVMAKISGQATRKEILQRLEVMVRSH